ncbi:MAG: flagellar hook capping FlgD N-terminal domain-containing protein [Phycisphaerae bacterium]|nr:flagellar hook capping FlgD N-terminal domain-containing protein [Phycisphaerae bacterium]
MPTVSPTSLTSAATAKTTSKSMSDMKPEDFLKLLITQLKNQDPFEPVKNQDLLDQISSIRQLQNSMDLSKTLTSTSLHQEITSAGGLIGKTVEGLNSTGDSVSGVVTSVSVKDKAVSLDLDTGEQVPLDNVTRVVQAGSTGATSSSGTNSSAGTPAVASTTAGTTPAATTTPTTPTPNSNNALSLANLTPPAMPDQNNVLKQP